MLRHRDNFTVTFYDLSLDIHRPDKQYDVDPVRSIDLFSLYVFDFHGVVT
jgi:hypothetical protein